MVKMQLLEQFPVKAHNCRAVVYCTLLLALVLMFGLIVLQGATKNGNKSEETKDRGTDNDMPSAYAKQQTHLDVLDAQLELLQTQLKEYQQQNIQLTSDLSAIVAKMNKIKETDDAQEIRISKLENDTQSKFTELETKILKQEGDIVDSTIVTTTRQAVLKMDVDHLKQECLNFSSTLNAQMFSCEQKVESVQGKLTSVETRLVVDEENYRNLLARVDSQFTNTNQVVGKLESKLNAQESSVKAHDKIACEHSKAVLECQESGKTIKIINANYGRTEPGSTICPHSSIRTTNCHSATSKLKVSMSCDGKNRCEVMASNSVFGDPCVGTYKYLKVEYTCDSVF